MSIALQAIVSLDTSAFSAGLSGLSQTVSNVTGAMSMAFGGVASEILMMAKAFGPFGAAVAVMKDAVSVGASFDQQMANIASVSGLTGKELRKVEIATRDLAKTTRFTATEAGDAMYSLASAGITGADALSNTLKPALLLAGATLSSTQTATEAMTAALANFQIPAAEAGRIADQFAGAIATSPATMERMSEAMKYAGPAAAGFGVALERTVAEMAAFHQVGLRGEMAGTSFRMALVQLSESAAKTGSEVGNALQGWDASTEGLTGAVRRLNSAGVDTAKVIAELGARAGPGMAALMKYGADAMDELAKRITNAADVSKMYETQLETLSGRFAIFKSAVEEVWLRLSGALTPALTELTKQATSAVDWIGNLAQALIEGKWQEAAEQIEALWESVKAGAMAFDWVGLLEDFRDLLQVVVQRIVEFGSKLMEQLGLTRTLSALKSAFDTVREAVTLLFLSVGRLAGQMRDVRWADVAKAAIAALDSALSFLLKTIDASLSAVIWLIEQWQALSEVTKTVVLSLVGGAGLVVALTRLIASMMSAATATIAFGVAQKANLISMAETAYIKMLLLRDAISSVTLAQAGMVAGAAVVGVALGTLIRQIPGVADACDNAAIAMGKFLGLHEVEDEVLKRRAAELKKQRQAQLAAMEAQEAANKAAREGIAVAADMTDAENEQLIAAWEQQNALDAQTNAQERLTAATRDHVSAAADMTDAENEQLVAAWEQQNALDAQTNATEIATQKAHAAASAQNDLSRETKITATELVGLLPAIEKFAKSGLGAFDVSKFTLALKQLQLSLKGIKFDDINLPDFSQLALPKISQYDVSQFLLGIKRLELGLRGVDLGFVGRLFGLDKFGGSANGPGGGRTLDDIYTLLADAKGIVWA